MARKQKQTKKLRRQPHKQKAHIKKTEVEPRVSERLSVVKDTSKCFNNNRMFNEQAG